MSLAFGFALPHWKILSGASGNSATNWYFAQLGLTGTPWADVSRTGLGTRVDSAGLVGFGPHNLALQSETHAGAALGSAAGSVNPPTISAGTYLGVTCEQIAFPAGVTGFGASRRTGNTSGQSGYFVQSVGLVYNATVNIALSRALVAGESIDVVATGVDTLAGALQITSATSGQTAFTRRSFASGTAAASGAMGVFVYSTLGLLSPISVYITQVLVCTGSLTEYIPTTTAARYLPRITHDPVTLAPLGLLVEGQATNLGRRTEEFSSASWVSYESTVTTNSGPGPSGETTADLFISTAVEDVHRLQMSPSVTNSGQHTMTWLVKAGTHRFVTIGFYGSVNAFIAATFDLLGSSSSATENYVGSSSGTIAYTSRRPGPNAFVELRISGSCGGASMVPFIAFAPSATGVNVTNLGQPVYLGSAAQNVLLGNFQLETGSVATSYIPNPGTGSAVRVADDWSLSGAALDAALGAARTSATLYFEVFIPSSIANDNRIFYLGNSGTTRRVDLAMVSGSTVNVYVDDGSSAGYMTAVTVTPNAVNRFAVSFDGANVRAAVNGLDGGTRASVFGGASMAERLYLLRQATGAAVVFSASLVRTGRAYPGRAMSVAEMQALTA